MYTNSYVYTLYIHTTYIKLCAQKDRVVFTLLVPLPTELGSIPEFTSCSAFILILCGLVMGTRVMYGIRAWLKV